MKSFGRDEQGLSLTEMLFVMPIVLLVITGMVEGGVLVYQWNQSTKAVQIGARLAAVSSPIVGDAAYAALSANPSNVPDGNAYPDTTVTVSCGPGAAACDATRLTRLLAGGDGLCDAGENTSAVLGMCDFFPLIGAENVYVSYYRSGLGYVGRPNGPVTNITVELRNMNFDFLLLDSLVPGLGTINIPAQPVSITSEDVSDCKNATCT